MALWGRNILTPITANYWSAHSAVWWAREMMLVGKWTENSNNGDAAWASALNVLATVAAGVNGLAVLASAPRTVTSPVNVFSSGMVGAVLSLFAVNDQNRSMWRISEYIDAKTIKVDPVSFSPYGWVDESGMAARITVGNGLLLTNGAWVLMDSPAGLSNMRVRLLDSDNVNSIAYPYARPKGKLGIATETGTSNIAVGTYSSRYRLNFHFDGVQGLMYWLDDYSGYLNLLQVGHLLDVDAADADPGFQLIGRNVSGLLPWNLTMNMLDGIDAAILAYPLSLKKYLGDNPNTAEVGLERKFARRLINGRPGFAGLRSPWVVLANTVNVGACVRGRLPLARFSNTGWERLVPMDAAGDWLHLYNGLVVPRNGPNDTMVVFP